MRHEVWAGESGVGADGVGAGEERAHVAWLMGSVCVWVYRYRGPEQSQQV